MAKAAHGSPAQSKPEGLSKAKAARSVVKYKLDGYQVSCDAAGQRAHIDAATPRWMRSSSSSKAHRVCGYAEMDVLSPATGAPWPRRLVGRGVRPWRFANAAVAGRGQSSFAERQAVLPSIAEAGSDKAEDLERILIQKPWRGSESE